MKYSPRVSIYDENRKQKDGPLWTKLLNASPAEVLRRALPWRVTGEQVYVKDLCQRLGIALLVDATASDTASVFFDIEHQIAAITTRYAAPSTYNRMMIAAGVGICLTRDPGRWCVGKKDHYAKAFASHLLVPDAELKAHADPIEAAARFNVPTWVVQDRLKERR